MSIQGSHRVKSSSSIGNMSNFGRTKYPRSDYSVTFSNANKELLIVGSFRPFSGTITCNSTQAFYRITKLKAMSPLSFI